MSTGKRVIRNSLYGVIGQAFGGGIFFFVAILVARHLGPEDFGTLTFILAFVTVFQMLADFGLTNVLVREIARNREKVSEILGAVMPLATLMAIIGSAIIAAAIWLMPLDPSAELAAFIMGGTVILTFHAAVAGNVSRAFEDMWLNAVGLMAQRVVLLVLILVAQQLDAGLPGIALCYFGERLFQWAFFRIVVRVRYTHYRWRLDFAYWVHLIREGLPVGIAMVLRRISWHIHTFMLTILSTSAAVGLFGSAYRVIQMINVIPFTLAVPMFPVLSRLAADSPEKAFAAYLRALRIFTLVGVPIGVWLTLVGHSVIQLLFGPAFAAAGELLRLMGAVVILLFLNGMFVYLFSALGQQRYYTISVSLSVTLNLLLDLVLIPVLGVPGVVISALIAEAAVFLSASWFLAQQGFVLNYRQIIGRPVCAALPAAVVLALAMDVVAWIPMLTTSVVFGALYLGLARLCGALDPKDVQALIRGIKR
jgi:O-antigen/teichoic acid export membrane protein